MPHLYSDYDASRRALAAQHDVGADEALTDALADNIELKTGWNGGYVSRIDTVEVLAELTENGWRLVRHA